MKLLKISLIACGIIFIICGLLCIINDVMTIGTILIAIGIIMFNVVITVQIYVNKKKNGADFSDYLTKTCQICGLTLNNTANYCPHCNSKMFIYKN